MVGTAGLTRVQRLATALKDEGLDAFFACSPISMRYLAGYGEYGHERFMALGVNSDGDLRLICPALSEQQARRAGIHDVRPWRDGEDPLALFEELATDWNLRSGMIAVDDEMSARQLLQMQSALPAALFKAGQPVLSTLMRKKDSAEIETMRRAGAIADQALSAGHRAIRDGATEREISDALSDSMRSLGGSPSFSIVGAGANGAEPHHLTDNTVVKRGDVLVLDFGCDLDGYQSDITRCASCGVPASTDTHKVYRVVYEAHMAGRQAIRPGVTAGEVDKACRDVIEQAGFGKFFVHRTGHGIGMHGHEEPYIAPGSDMILEEGDCFSIEPGVYLPGEFGIRIENIVTVTAGGHESLNAEPEPRLVEI